MNQENNQIQSINLHQSLLRILTCEEQIKRMQQRYDVFFNQLQIYRQILLKYQSINFTIEKKENETDEDVNNRINKLLDEMDTIVVQNETIIEEMKTIQTQSNNINQSFQLYISECEGNAKIFQNQINLLTSKQDEFLNKLEEKEIEMIRRNSSELIQIALNSSAEQTSHINEKYDTYSNVNTFE